MKFYVYTVTCIANGMQYVGKTCSPARRWWQHKNCAKRGLAFPLYVAMRELGVDAFEFAVLHECQSEAQALELERALVVSRQTLVPAGYNSSPGWLTLPSSEELQQIRSRISSARSGRSAPKTAEQHYERTKERAKLRNRDKRKDPLFNEWRALCERERRAGHVGPAKISFAEYRRAHTPQLRLVGAKK